MICFFTYQPNTTRHYQLHRMIVYVFHRYLTINNNGKSRLINLRSSRKRKVYPRQLKRIML
ncbi:hypothetical protein BDA99DRAFT_510805 [Phascolomyces articulosus]|uniref:Uncharacterized protein n=1 Tax=Phascolomyces articulosus TaxID=60185 RepID=A0AAD5K9U3_9FUNG|nr:hypothetical protein BDA99DRAFT_510805 [Phascolomyces articulosus]